MQWASVFHKLILFQPVCSWFTASRTVCRYDIQAVCGLLRQGITPVLHGDVILDEMLGCCILSGDTIIKVCTVYGKFLL